MVPMTFKEAEKRKKWCDLFALNEKLDLAKYPSVRQITEIQKVSKFHGSNSCVCMACGLQNWQGRRFSAIGEIDHISRAVPKEERDKLENKRCICPNCHQLTKTRYPSLKEDSQPINVKSGNFIHSKEELIAASEELAKRERSQKSTRENPQSMAAYQAIKTDGNTEMRSVRIGDL